MIQLTEMTALALTLLSLLFVHASGVSFGLSDVSVKKEDFSRINRYELIDLTFDGENGLLSFSNFGERYDLYLSKNEDLVLSNIRHMINGKRNDYAYNGSMATESCHYHIFASDNSDSSKIAGYKSAYGVISQCSEYGMKGFISLSNKNAYDEKSSETLIINPAIKYNELLSNNDNISNKYMIFKKSDFNNTDMIEKNRNINIGVPNNIKNSEKNENSDLNSHIIVDNGNSENNRQLLATYNNGNNEVELIIYVDPYAYADYLTTYGASSYYNELVDDVGTIVTATSNEFLSTDWGNDIGDISVHFVAIDVISSFSGTYASLQPDWYNDESLDRSDYISNLANWLDSNALGSAYDHSMVLTGVTMNEDCTWYGTCTYTGGVAYEPGICRDHLSASIVWLRDFKYYSSDVQHTAKHELGHSFGAPHDQDTTCGNDGGIMGYGDNQEYFSSCTISSVQSFFSGSQKISCLGDGVRSFTDDSTDDYDDDDDFEGCSYTCIGLYNSGYYGYDNEWYYNYCDDNGNAVYRIYSWAYWSYYYLYYNTPNGQWHISNSVETGSTVTADTLLCPKNNVLRCGYGKWYDYDNGWQVIGAITYQCYDSRVSGESGTGTGTGTGTETETDTETDTDTDTDTAETESESTNYIDNSDDDGSDVGYGINFNLTHNCSENNLYGNNVCIYNDGTLWADGISNFIFEGVCKSNYPIYYYKGEMGNFTISYYLYFDNNNKKWIISSKGIDDVMGEAYCEIDSNSNNNLLSDCGYDTWYVVSQDTDAIFWTLSESMGYDANCESVTTDDNTQYCKSNFACAQWQLKFSINNNNISSNSKYCSDSDDITSDAIAIGDTIGACVTETLLSEWTEIDSGDVSFECDSHSLMILTVNVSFTSILGASMYFDFIDDYASIFENCDNDITADVVYSTLNVCDNCQSFWSNDNNNNNDNNENNESAAHAHHRFRFSLLLLQLIVACFCTYVVLC